MHPEYLSEQISTVLPVTSQTKKTFAKQPEFLYFSRNKFGKIKKKVEHDEKITMDYVWRIMLANQKQFEQRFGVLEKLFEETREQFKETDRRLDKRFEKTDERITSIR